MNYRLALTALLVACSFLLSGCYSINMISADAIQAGPGSPQVTITLQACVAGEPGGESASADNSKAPAISLALTTEPCSTDQPLPAGHDDRLVRYLAIVLVPAGTSAPASIVTSAGRALTFTSDAVLAASIQRYQPVPGYTWLAWKTASGEEFRPSPDTFTVPVALTLPADGAGHPLTDTLHYRAALEPAIADEKKPTAPVLCMESTGFLLIGGLPCIGHEIGKLHEITIDRGTQAVATGVDLCANLAGEQTVLLLDEQRLNDGTCVSRRIGDERHANILPGTQLGEVMYGGALADQIAGQGGADIIFSAKGNDRVDGGAGNDRVYGGRGNDQIAGAAGNDLLLGESGNDAISGGAGNDIIYGGGGNDRISGDAGNDRIEGGDGRDTLIGGAGNDTLDAADSDRDVVNGGPGRDLCIINKGDRTISCEKIIVRKAVKPSEVSGFFDL